MRFESSIVLAATINQRYTRPYQGNQGDHTYSYTGIGGNHGQRNAHVSEKRAQLFQRTV